MNGVVLDSGKSSVLRGRARFLGLKTLLAASLIIAIASILLLSFVPPVSKDALIHHLAVPNLYLRHGAMLELPSMEFSYFPMNLELLYLIPLYLGNDIAPKLIHFGFALLTAWLIFNYLRRRLSTTYGLLGAICFLSIPIIIKLSITVYVDLGLIFFTTGSLFLILRWIESDFSGRFLILSAISCGLAMGTKYNGLITFLILALLVPFFYSRYARGKGHGFVASITQGVIFFVIALLVFSPWMARNYYWKGNPIYPLFNTWFNPRTAAPTDIDASGGDKESDSGVLTFRRIVYKESGWQIALLPVRVFYQGKDGAPQYFDGRLNPFLLILPFFAFYRAREESRGVGREKWIMLIFAALFFWIAIFSTVLRVRYISPIIPPLVILSVFGIRNMINSIRRFHVLVCRQVGLTMVGLIVIFFLTLNALYVVDQFRYVDPFSYLSGRTSRAEYISKYRFEHPAMQYINDNLPHNALIMSAFLGKRGYYCERDYILDQQTILSGLINGSQAPQEIWIGLKEMGVTHLIIQSAFFGQWAANSLTPRELSLLQRFFDDHAIRLYQKNGVEVFSLKSRESPGVISSK